MALPLPPLKNPGYVAPGVKETTAQETVSIGSAAASHPISFKIPLRAVVTAVALHVPQVVSAATAVKIGVGRSTSTADPDKYALTADLAATDIARMHNGWGAPIADAGGEALAIFACAADGTAAGTIGGADQYVIVSVTYVEPQFIY
jgi:hypothetical protein